jgi:DNA-binding MarR family transcriptional regulator
MKIPAHKGIVGKVSAVMRNRKTYQIGLLQAKAYRILKQHTSSALEPMQISTTEWAFLGLLYDQENAVRASFVAEELGVEAPFITVLLKKLKTRGLVTSYEDPDDNRAKLLCLTTEGRQFVIETEIIVLNKIRLLARDAGINNVAGYISVLESIIENSLTVLTSPSK